MNVVRSASFEKNIKKYRKEREIIKRVQKHIQKIIDNPEVGYFLKGQRKRERKIYIPPFRLLYAYSKDEDTPYFLDFDHRDIIYKKKK